MSDRAERTGSADVLVKPPLPEPGFDIVHFVLGYYDGVLEGIADCSGAPHHVVLEAYGPNEKGFDRYRLTPLSPDVFRAAVDGWDIWCRWEGAYRAGQVGLDSEPNPALPSDQDRRREIEELLAAWLHSARTRSFVKDGEFKPLLLDVLIGTTRGALQVRWTDPP